MPNPISVLISLWLVSSILSFGVTKAYFHRYDDLNHSTSIYFHLAMTIFGPINLFGFIVASHIFGDEPYSLGKHGLKV